MSTQKPRHEKAQNHTHTEGARHHALSLSRDTHSHRVSLSHSLGHCGRKRDCWSHSLGKGGNLRGAGLGDSAESTVRKKSAHSAGHRRTATAPPAPPQAGFTSDTHAVHCTSHPHVRCSCFCFVALVEVSQALRPLVPRRSVRTFLSLLFPGTRATWSVACTFSRRLPPARGLRVSDLSTVLCLFVCQFPINARLTARRQFRIGLGIVAGYIYSDYSEFACCVALALHFPSWHQTCQKATLLLVCWFDIGYISLCTQLMLQLPCGSVSVRSCGDRSVQVQQHMPVCTCKPGCST